MRGKNAGADVLARVPLFEGISKQDLQRVVGAMEEETYTRGDTIVSEGTTGGRFYVLLEGRAKVTAKGRELRTLGPGDSFGEISLIDGGERLATVQAETDVRALTLSSWNFVAMLEESWPMARAVMLALCRLIRSKELDA